jgi:transcriptional regulator with XRE-family HTH domain
MLRIKEFREERGWSQTKLSRETGITQATLSNVERGIHDPHLATLHKVADALGVPVIALLGEEEETSSKEEAPEERLRKSLRALLRGERRSLFLAGVALSTDLWIAGVSQADLGWLKNFAAHHDTSPEKVIRAMHELWPELRDLQCKLEDRARIEAQKINAEVDDALGRETA